ncbi:hypothetical protein FO519_001420 [Halicephalobus sp. NKZ332]|nr:hypothetical protein FO519_001420 [Halicephalobus sp. NKZ332]
MPLEDNLGEFSNQRTKLYDEKKSIIGDLKDSNREALKKNISSSKKIDSQFELDEDDKEDNVDKYGSDLDISSEEEVDEDEEVDQLPNLDSDRRGNVPHSMPINVDFGIDPLTRRPRNPVARSDKKEKHDKIQHESIYENMQELSRSIQPADYRNRVLGTRPDNVGLSMSYSACTQLNRPRAIICNEPAKRLDVTLEGTPDLET